MYSAIKMRKSVKHYKSTTISQSIKDDIFAYINEVAIPFTNEKIDVHFLENGPEIQNNFKGITKMYGKLNSPHFLAFSSNDNTHAREAIGYLGELVSLHLLNMQIASCWVALSKANQLPITLKEGHKIYSLLAIGYPEEPIRPMLSRNRMPLDSFVSGDIHAQFIPVIESVIDAPSSGNSQPWTFKFDDQQFIYTTTEPIQSLFSKQRQIFNDLNRGIGLAHIIVALEHFNINYSISNNNKNFVFNY